MKRFAALVLLLMLLPLSGCNGNLLTVEGAMQPPRLTEQQNAIYEALKAQVGSNIQLKYPQTGEYRSAFVLKYIDSEPTNEAIVFYQNSLQANSGTAVRVNVLDQTGDGSWVSMCDIAGEAADVDQIVFGNFGSGDPVNLVIGYRGDGKRNRILTIYRYAEGMLRAVDSREYEALSLLRTPDTPLDHLVYVSNKGNSAQTTAKLLCYEPQKGFVVKDEVAMYEPVEEYVNLVSGYIAGNGSGQQSALFMDGKVGNELCTEILTVYNDALYNCTYQENAKNNLVTATLRDQTLYSSDISHDRYYKVPHLALMPGYNNTSGLSYTEWMAYEEGRFLIKETSYVDTANGFRFQVPDNWKEEVSASVLADQNEVKFFRYTGDLKDETQEILRIRTLQRSDTAQKNLEGYFKIASIGQIGYWAKINPDADERYRLTKEDVYARFSTLL